MATDLAARSHIAAQHRDGAHPSTVSPAHALLGVFTSSLTGGTGGTVRAARCACCRTLPHGWRSAACPPGVCITFGYVKRGAGAGLAAVDFELFATAES
jgi:hypothetical protein